MIVGPHRKNPRSIETGGWSKSTEARGRYTTGTNMSCRRQHPSDGTDVVRCYPLYTKTRGSSAHCVLLPFTHGLGCRRGATDGNVSTAGVSHDAASVRRHGCAPPLSDWAIRLSPTSIGHFLHRHQAGNSCTMTTRGAPPQAVRPNVNELPQARSRRVCPDAPSALSSRGMSVRH